MLTNVEIKFEVDEAKFLYVFGTHIKNLKTREYLKLGLSENEILKLQVELSKVLDKLIFKTLKKNKSEVK